MELDLWTYIVWIFSGSIWTPVYIVVYVDVFYVDTMYASGYWCLLMFEMLFQVPLPLTYVAMIIYLFITCIHMIWDLNPGL